MIATLLQRAISCGDTHEDTVAAYELARTHSREGQVYILNFMYVLCLCMEFIEVYVYTMFISHFNIN